MLRPFSCRAVLIVIAAGCLTACMDGDSEEECDDSKPPHCQDNTVVECVSGEGSGWNIATWYEYQDCGDMVCREADNSAGCFSR